MQVICEQSDKCKDKFCYHRAPHTAETKCGCRCDGNTANCKPACPDKVEPEKLRTQMQNLVQDNRRLKNELHKAYGLKPQYPDQIYQPDGPILSPYVKLRRQVQTQRECIENLCCQFASWNKGLSTGSLSALEDAFTLLGWDDPHLAKFMECDEPGCDKQANCGWPSGKKYRRTCGKHMEQEAKQ